jgi:hypothetical protein
MQQTLKNLATMITTSLQTMTSFGRPERLRLEATSPGTPLRTAVVLNARCLAALPRAHLTIRADHTISSLAPLHDCHQHRTDECLDNQDAVTIR